MSAVRIPLSCCTLIDNCQCVTVSFHHRSTGRHPSCLDPRSVSTTAQRCYTHSGKQPGPSSANLIEGVPEHEGENLKSSLSSWMTSLKLPTVELSLPKWFVLPRSSSFSDALPDKPTTESAPNKFSKVTSKIKKDAAKVSDALYEKRLHLKKYERQVKTSLQSKDEFVNREHHSFERHIQEINQGIASFYDSSVAINQPEAPVLETQTTKKSSGFADQAVTKEQVEDTTWNKLLKLPSLLRFKKSEKAEIDEQKSKQAKPLIRKDFVSKFELERRTKGLIDNLKSASSNMSQVRRIEELCSHLLLYPDVRSVAKKEKLLPLLMKLTKSDDTSIRAQAYEALSLVGHVFPPQGRGIRILSVDGGGTRGLIAIETLRMLEMVCNKELNKMFDYVIGTSTGALVVALFFMFRLPIDECQELYIDKSRQMFTQTKWRGMGNLFWDLAFHDSPRWEAILKEKMGDRYMIDFARDPSYPKMSATSVLVNVAKWKTFMFRNYNLPPGVYSDYPGNCKQKLWEAIRASSAAPGFYKEFHLGEFIHRDGGLINNNPTALAIHESKLLWPNESIQCVVSIGNGRFEPSLEVSAYKGGLKDIATSIVDSATDTEGVHMTMKDLLPNSTYYRFNPYLSEESLLDEIRPEKIYQMQQDARMYLRKNHSKLLKASNQLKLKRLPHQKLMDSTKLTLDSI